MLGGILFCLEGVKTWYFRVIFWRGSLFFFEFGYVCFFGWFGACKF